MRELVRRLDDLFTALGYKTVPQEHRLSFEDTALLTKSEQVIVAGQARSVRDEEITFEPPHFVVVEDAPPEEHVARLQAACKLCKAPPTLINFSRFIDPLWQAAHAVAAAQRDAQAAADLDIATGLTDPERPDPMDLYVDQSVSAESGTMKSSSALVATEEWLNKGTGTLVVLAPAGLGKSELAGILEWRASLRYLTGSSQSDLNPPPPAAIRVPLREIASLSLSDIAEYLRRARGLERIRNVEVLSQLLLHNRLVLLLDGLDELPSPRSMLEEGLGELKFISGQGARVMITSRSGYYGSESSIRARLGSESILMLDPLDEEHGKELLRKRGGSAQEAKTAVEALPPELRGVPLFLIWAWRSRFKGEVGDEDRASQARVLLNLVRLFCIRDEPRIKVEADKQIQILKELAYNSGFIAPVPKGDFMYLVGAEESPFVEGPHALLRIGEADQVRFRDATFESLFLAHSVLDKWRSKTSEGPAQLKEWLGERLGAVKLDSLAIEYLAELLQPGEVRSAWTLSSQAPVRYQPYTRRNLLGVALAHVRGPGERESPPARSARLEQVIGTRDLSDTGIADLVIEMFDFRGWDLRRCDGRGGYFAFCNFEGAEFDEGIQAADVVSSTGLERRDREAETLARGLRRLERVLGPWRNHALGADAIRPRLAEDTKGLDVEAMKRFRAQGFAERSQGEAGAWFWSLTDSVRPVLREILRTPGVSPPELRDLLLELGKMP